MPFSLAFSAADFFLKLKQTALKNLQRKSEQTTKGYPALPACSLAKFGPFALQAKGHSLCEAVGSQPNRWIFHDFTIHANRYPTGVKMDSAQGEALGLRSKSEYHIPYPYAIKISIECAARIASYSQVARVILWSKLNKKGESHGFTLASQPMTCPTYFATTPPANR